MTAFYDFELIFKIKNMSTVDSKDKNLYYL